VETGDGRKFLSEGIALRGSRAGNVSEAQRDERDEMKI
jgi:hypothetical protein